MGGVNGCPLAAVDRRGVAELGRFVDVPAGQTDGRAGLQVPGDDAPGVGDTADAEQLAVEHPDSGAVRVGQ
ncbi:hypothetical protein CMT96_19315 [Elizabethkingia anophelis]|nr:hypothetical protein [Elizabethkingia anophelis]